MFGIKKKAQKPWSFSVPYTHNFRGTKRVKLTTYMDKWAEEGIAATLGKEIKEFRFEKVKGYDGLTVYADGKKIGTIWRNYWPEVYDRIIAKEISEAHVQFGGDVYFFVK